MKKETIQQNYTTVQLISLTVLRVLIGWHFLYEGLVKLYTPGWTAKDYLLGSAGPIALIFNSLAKSSSVLHFVDLVNEWGLVIIGIGLFIGLFSKPLKILGVLFLLLYYLAYPPFPDLTSGVSIEGSYWIVNKNLIELAALCVLFFFPSSYITGIDRFIQLKKHK